MNKKINTDKKLVFSGLDKDKDEFWNLWEQNKDSMFRKCMCFMKRDVHEAEEILSIAMLKAANKFITYASTSHPKINESVLLNTQVEVKRKNYQHGTRTLQPNV